MGQPDMFDTDEARKARDAALAAVEDGADASWKEAALAAVAKSALVARTITADEVMQRLNMEDVHTHELRALGPVMLKAARQGWIRKSNQAGRMCARPSRHCAPLTVWESLICRSADPGSFKL